MYTPVSTIPPSPPPGQNFCTPLEHHFYHPPSPPLASKSDPPWSSDLANLWLLPLVTISECLPSKHKQTLLAMVAGNAWNRNRVESIWAVLTDLAIYYKSILSPNYQQMVPLLRTFLQKLEVLVILWVFGQWCGSVGCVNSMYCPNKKVFKCCFS